MTLADTPAKPSSGGRRSVPVELAPDEGPEGRRQVSPGETLRLGTRRSRLAMAQSGMVARWLEEAHPGLMVQLVPIVTEGDRRPGSLAGLGGKGLFTQELEAGLAEGSLDLAVHSLKDLPSTLPDELDIAAYPERADPRDALVSHLATTLEELPAGATVLTGALRRRSQILNLRADLEVRPLRGNVETRLNKWQASGAAGVVLATAGLARLGIDNYPIHPLSTSSLLPAPGQGTLAVQTQRGSRAEELCRALDHLPTRQCSEAERSLVLAMGGDCALPLAAWARTDGDRLRLSALVADPNGQRLVRAEALGTEPLHVAARCAETLLEQGAESILAAVRGVK
ncbi:MAG: hydroxymethylbilane synthase [Thermoanaerobaculia bacterium]|nr:hydroxymethylbilane synthase [Thermoanaerobaculia bacterium]